MIADLSRMSKKKILLLSDELRCHSGVGTMSKEIVYGTAHKYDWVQLGAAINHPEAGKVIDISADVDKEQNIQGSNVKIYPSSGYGTATELRKLISLEKPDALFIFTDPRYWIWLFQMEREIRSQIPIIYLNIWDDLPYPMWNKPYYESCDGLLAISKQTYNINKVILGENLERHTVEYVPHGISSKYFPISATDSRVIDFKKNYFKGSQFPEFILLYNARNLGRKHPADLILAWQDFCKKIGPIRAKKCTLIMHTDVIDSAGTNLQAVYEDLCNLDSVKIIFDEKKYSLEDMNLLYNMSDGVILPSSNEGWGLSITEALNTGKMFIATVTGGMQDQMRFEDENGVWINFTKDFPSNHNGTYKDHGEWCIPIFPSVRSLAGSPTTPYVFDDRVSIEDISEAIFNLYSLDKKERIVRGSKGRDWAISPEAGFTASQMCERIISGIEKTFDTYTKFPRSRYDLIEVGERTGNKIDYNPIRY